MPRLVALAVTLLAAVAPLQAGPITFSDGFEAPTINPFWTQTQQSGSISYGTALIPYLDHVTRGRGGNPVARIPFVRHRTVRQIWNKYRACREGVEKTRWQAVWLLARTDTPRTPAQVADVVGLSAVTVRQVLHRWNADGPTGLADGRKGNGSPPKLTARRRDALYAALQKRPPDGGLWTGPKVARYVADRWGVTVDPTTGWRWLRGLGFTLQVPRPTHPNAADAPTRRRWKNTCDGGSAG